MQTIQIDYKKTVTDLIAEGAIAKSRVRQYVAHLLVVGEAIPAELISSILLSVDLIEKVDKLLKEEAKSFIEVGFADSPRLV